MRKKTLVTAITLFLAVLVAAGIVLATSRDAEAISHTEIAKFNSLNTLVLKTYNDWRTNYDTYRTSSAYDWMDWSEDGCSTPWDVTVPYKVSRASTKHASGVSTPLTVRPWESRQSQATGISGTQQPDRKECPTVEKGCTIDRSTHTNEEKSKWYRN